MNDKLPNPTLKTFFYLEKGGAVLLRKTAQLLTLGTRFHLAGSISTRPQDRDNSTTTPTPLSGETTRFLSIGVSQGSLECVGDR
ncbi:hypothetical protein JTE90_000973 [Oedothorax gibbosus]|uniref:Uncharacterized protein n=1 Tax=Oedothorax gibbosus TaxID=931172 RepID=A0AAV6VE25_9ARAC|nr:hypothetical protein JTE90_000973 [Oedothorax gibbosus]